MHLCIFFEALVKLLMQVSEDLAKGKNIIALSLSHNKIVAIPGTVSCVVASYCCLVTLQGVA